jgi:hypothetical protein
MVQATRQFFSLLALAFTTLNTAYAAPTARAPDCATSLTPNVLLYVRAPQYERQLQLIRSPANTEGFTDHLLMVSRFFPSCLSMLTIIKVCPNGSCTSTPTSRDWYLKDGVLIPHSADRTTIDLPVAPDSKLTFRLLGGGENPPPPATAHDFCAKVSRCVLIALLRRTDISSSPTALVQMHGM